MKYSVNYILIIILLASACTKKLELPDIEPKEKITLIGELVAGDTFYVRSGKGVPVTKNNNVQFELLSDLKLTITEGGSNSIVLKEKYETIVGQAYTSAFTSSEQVEENKQYTVTSTHPQLGVAYADVRVPRAFSAVIKDTATVLYSSAEALQADINIQDNSGEENFYVIEVLEQRVAVKREFYYGTWLDYDIARNKRVYDSLLNKGLTLAKRSDTTFYRAYIRQGVYSTDPNTENFKDGDAYALSKRILLRDRFFSGGVHNTRIYIRTASPEIEEGANNGVLQILVKSVPKEYFEYLKAYEKYDPSISYNTFTSPVNLKGNINNGLGMVGAAYEHRFTYWLDSWDF